MIESILYLLPLLLLAITTNIVLGTYNSLFKLKKDFSIKIMLEGIYKAFVISFGFISTSIIWDKMIGIIKLDGTELSPDLLIKSVIIMYMTKALINLKDILKVDKIFEDMPNKEGK